MTITYGSVCSGIEAASVAFAPLGWSPAWFSEIERFPCAVLAHHFPAVPNLGDMTTIARRVLAGEVDAPDVLCGGTPCQAFSVAGLRESLNDSRGNLTIKFVGLADAIDHVRVRAGKPACTILWENVPGVLSTKDNAYGCFLAGLAGEDEPLQPPGKGWTDAGAVYGPSRAIAWRTLDAQYFGLAQRRRRVFVVASARNGFDPCTVLFEWQGVRRDTAPSRETGQDTAGTISARTEGGGGLGTDFDLSGGVQVTSTLDASYGRVRGAGGQDANHGHSHLIAFGGNNTAGPIDIATACNAHGGAGRMDFESETFVAHSLRGEGFDASEDGTGRGTPLIPVLAVDTRPTITFNATDYESGAFEQCDSAGPLTTSADRTRAAPIVTAFSSKDHGADAADELSPTLRAMNHGDSHANGGGQVAVAFQSSQSGVRTGDAHATIDAHNGSRRHNGVIAPSRVRRLTPRECERLQGFADDFTLIPDTKVKRFAPKGSGPCVKQTVVATVVDIKGRHFVGTNHCMRPQATCARAGMPSGGGYHLCREVCQQPAHAEINAINLAGKATIGATLYLQGHTYACESCTDAARRAGISEIIIGPPPGNAADGPRYKALGNSWAVPCVRWIAHRINQTMGPQ